MDQRYTRSKCSPTALAFHPWGCRVRPDAADPWHNRYVRPVFPMKFYPVGRGVNLGGPVQWDRFGTRYPAMSEAGGPVPCLDRAPARATDDEES